MNKSFLKDFAVKARVELIDRIRQKAFEIGFREEKASKANLETSDALYINGVQLNIV